MRWLSTGLFVVAFVAVSPGAAWTQPKAKEDNSKYAGKTFDQWKKEISHPDPSKRETAIRVVCLFPPATAVKALPALLAELKRSVPSQPTDLSVRVNICVALADLFSNGEKIETKLQAEAAQALRTQLRDSQAILRYRAAAALASLGSIGTEARVATPELTGMLKDATTWEVRQAGASALAAVNGGNENGPPVEVLQSLYGSLRDPAYQVRLAAVQSLSALGPAGQEQIGNYVNALLPTALKDPEPGLQIWARVAIIGATNDFKKDHLTPIMDHMEHVDPGIRAQAVQAIGMMGDKAKIGVSKLTGCLNDQDGTVQASAIWALGRMGSLAASAVPALRKIADDPASSDHLKRSATAAIEKITKK